MLAILFFCWLAIGYVCALWVFHREDWPVVADGDIARHYVWSAFFGPAHPFEVIESPRDYPMRAAIALGIWLAFVAGALL